MKFGKRSEIVRLVVDCSAISLQSTKALVGMVGGNVVAAHSVCLHASV